MVLFINKADICQYKQVSNSVTADILNSFIMDAQLKDLQKLMGKEFFFDLIANWKDAKYKTLLDGGTYVYQTKTYENFGLKSVLSYYAYARYVLYGTNIDTPFGFVTKNNADSTPVSWERRKDIYKDNQQTAYSMWETVVEFINRNTDDYPLFNFGAGSDEGFTISKIGGKDGRSYPATASRFSYE